MKKIFTLVFSIGLMASAFAQSGHRQQNQNSGNSYQPTQYSRNNQANTNSNTGYYDSNSQSNRRDGGNEYAYNNNDRHSNDRVRNDGDRNYRSRDEHFTPVYNNERRGRDVHYQPARFPPLQIIFGIGGR